MSSPILPAKVDPSIEFRSGELTGKRNSQQLQPQSGFPPEVPRHPLQDSPEWSPQRPQEAPHRAPTPIPDWSPSSTAPESPIIDEPQNPTKHDSPARPDGKHDLGDDPDERTGPEVVEDPSPEGHPADEGGDIEEPGAQNPSSFDLDAVPATSGLTPSGRQLRPTSAEAYY